MLSEAFVEIHEHTEVYGVWLVAQPPCGCGECPTTDIMLTLLRDGDEDWRAVARVAVRRAGEVSKSGTTARRKGATREQAVAMAEDVVRVLLDALGPGADVESVIIDAKGTTAMQRFLAWSNAHPLTTAPGGLA